VSEPISYGFDDRLAMSCGTAASSNIGEILLANIPGATQCRRANQNEDKHGTDWWVDHVRGSPLSVDVKVREEDYAAKPKSRAADDLALETFSVVESSKTGWTRDECKRTDYILWYWKDTGRFCLLPFAMLCAVFREEWQKWKQLYKTRSQHTPGPNGGYHSECVFVPRREVWAAIYRKFGGTPRSPRP